MGLGGCWHKVARLGGYEEVWHYTNCSSKLCRGLRPDSDRVIQCLKSPSAAGRADKSQGGPEAKGKELTVVPALGVSQAGEVGRSICRKGTSGSEKGPRAVREKKESG